jgi:hypothetical protein
MKSNGQRRTIEDQDVAEMQKTSSGAFYPRETQSTSVEAMQHQTEFPDLGETTKLPERPPEAELVRCPRCGMEKIRWSGGDGAGFSSLRGERFCCEGCASGNGCTCTGEQQRHTGENVGQER